MEKITVTMDVYIRQCREYTIEVPDDFPPMEEWSPDHYDNIHDWCQEVDEVVVDETIERCEVVDSSTYDIV